jgi:nucleotide-binding universal stress UspA family protein
MLDAPRRTRDRWRRRRAVGYHRILIPLATDASSQRALDLACRLAADRNVKVTAPVPMEVPLDLPLMFELPDDEKQARRVAAEARAIGESYGVDVNPRIVRTRDATAAILESADDDRVEVIVLPTSRDPYRRLRGTAQHVLRSATCRLMLVAEHDPPADRSARMSQRSHASARVSRRLGRGRRVER